MKHRGCFPALWFCLATALALGGCATPADRQAMTAPAPAVAGKQHPHSVGVTVQGGSDTGAMDSSNIANADLEAAIEESIQRSMLFKQVLQGKAGEYELAVSIVRLSKPVMGFSFTVELETAWSLVRSRDKQAVLRQVFTSNHTATMSDAFAGITRLRLAVEGAARANIQMGLEAIGRLEL